MTHAERLLKLLRSRKKGFTAMEIRERLGISNVADAVMEIRRMSVWLDPYKFPNGTKMKGYHYPYSANLITTMETGTNRYGEKVRYARYSLKD